MFTNQISSLRKLIFLCNPYISFNYYFTGMRDLLELHCISNLPSDFFYQLSQTCHNLQSIYIKFFNDNIPNEIKELISLQNNLKNLTLSTHDGMNCISWKDILPALTKHSNTIIKLHIYKFYRNNNNMPLSFVGILSNLQEVIFLFLNGKYFEDFKILQNVDYEF